MKDSGSVLILVELQWYFGMKEWSAPFTVLLRLWEYIDLVYVESIKLIKETKK